MKSGGGGKKPEGFKIVPFRHSPGPGMSVHRKEIRSDRETEAGKGACPRQDHTSDPAQFNTHK